MRNVLFVLGLSFLFTTQSFAKSLDQSSAPTDNLSPMYTLEQISQKVTNATSTAAAGNILLSKTFAIRTDDGGGGESAVTGTLVGTYGIPKTGQTTSYQVGDDGYYKKGTPTSGSRFKDNADGTITDNGTGLMWVKDPSQIPGGTWGSPGSPSFMTWSDAIINCENLSYAGYTDWRLPNIKELISIVDYSRAGPAINETYFPNTTIGIYWSSTNYLDTVDAWNVYFNDGSVDLEREDQSYCVRPVRAGQ